MSRWIAALGIAVALLLACESPAAQPDPVKAKLDKTRAAYESELAAADKSVFEALDKAEAAARKRGDKAAVDKVKADREMFELTGVPPKSVPAAVAQKAAAARKTLDAALAAAVMQYTKANKDAEATAAEREREKLKDAPALRPRHFLVVNKNSDLALSAAKEKGYHGSGLLQAKTTGADNQLWSLVATETPDVYLLRNKAGGYFAGTDGSTDADHTLTLEKDGKDGNRWVLEREGFHFLFQNAHSKLYMSVSKASKEAGERVNQWQKGDKSEDQRWNLVAAKPK